MSGKYERAPLIYVTASIHTTGLPKLVNEQPGLLQQLMIQHGFPDERGGEQQTFSFKIDPKSSGDSIGKADTLHRKGFFSPDGSESVIFNDSIIEYRTTKYEDYETLCGKLTLLFRAIFESISVYKDVFSKELAMSYADVILPYTNRQLSDYFIVENSMPRTFLNDLDQNDLQVVGNVSLSRIVSPEHKVNISLEQLPIIDGKIPKLLPNELTEPDNKFGMPLFVTPNVEEVNPSEYALLLTQSMMLVSKKLSELDIKTDFEPLHESIKSSFKNIINHDVCNYDWKYVEEQN
jgi:uncharacterized protein (TIGR04255 family)